MAMRTKTKIATTWLAFFLSPISALGAPGLIGQRCNITAVTRSTSGVDIFLGYPERVAGPPGEFMIDSQQKLHTAYPAKAGDRLSSMNSPEDSCLIKVDEQGLTASASFHPPWSRLPGQDATVSVSAVSSVEELPKQGYICWLKGAVKTPGGIDVYFSGQRMVSGPSGSLLVNSDPGEVRKAYPAEIGDTVRISMFCTAEVQEQHGVIGLLTHFRERASPTPDGDEFIPAQ